MGPGFVSGSSIAFPDLVAIIGAVLQRRLVDKTGLSGRYDFKLEWTPDALSNTGVGPFARGGPLAPQIPPSSEAANVSVFANIEDQLGLKLERRRGPVQILVIDHVEQPTPD